MSGNGRTEPGTAPSLSHHHPLGISTGVFKAGCTWPAMVAEACKISTFAIELSALSERELPALISYFAEKPRLPFRYVSVHAPVKDQAIGEGRLTQLLDQLPLWVRSIVTHPDVLGDTGLYRALATRIVLENMDDRKRTGRTADELEETFEQLPLAGFCFDVAHAHSVDPSMEAAHEMLNRFRSRLRHVHVSSLRNGKHVPLTQDDEVSFAPILARCHDVPWILEARPPRRWSSDLRPTQLVAAGAPSS